MKKILLKVNLILFITLMGFIVFITMRGYRMYVDAIELTPIEKKIENIKQSKENYAEYSEIPQMYVNALIATEDRRFYEHRGIDFIGIGRAIFTDIKNKSFSEGGSTITQQLVKNIYFTQERTSRRKIAEIFMASKFEKNCSKEQIIELYANTSYFGHGYYSIKDASIGYFDKGLDEVTDYECAMLAGIPNAPSKYDPIKNLELAKQRTQQVLRKMVKFGYITQEKMDNILKDEE